MSSIAVFQHNGLVTVFNAVIDGIEQLAVNARDLHQFLKVKSRFNDWIKGRIKEYGFAVTLDFISFTKNSVKPKGGRPTTEYHLTLDMAKELAMVENNEQGRKVRRYFIQCERNLHKTSSEQRKVFIAACDKLAVGNTLRSDVYTQVANHFGYAKPVDLPADLLVDATAYVYEQILAKTKSGGYVELTENQQIHAKKWHIVGSKASSISFHVLKDMEDALFEMREALQKAQRLNAAVHGSFDQTLRVNPHHTKVAMPQAKALLEKYT